MMKRLHIFVYMVPYRKHVRLDCLNGTGATIAIRDRTPAGGGRGGRADPHDGGTV